MSKYIDNFYCVVSEAKGTAWAKFLHSLGSIVRDCKTLTASPGNSAVSVIARRQKNKKKTQQNSCVKCEENLSLRSG